MKYVKILGLVATAAMALMAFLAAGTASATVLCREAKTSGCTNDYAAKQRIVATTEQQTTGILETTGGAILDTCVGSEIKGEIGEKGTGGASAAVSGPLDPIVVDEGGKETSGLEWGTCSRPTKTLKVGTFEVHHIAGTDNGTLTATGGIEVTINIIFGTCVFGTGEALDVGKITGGKPATINTEKAVIPKRSGSPVCPTHALWDAQFTVTTPGEAWVSAS